MNWRDAGEPSEIGHKHEVVDPAQVWKGAQILNERTEMTTSRDEIMEDLTALINHAEHLGKWLHCSYQDLWFSPSELRSANAQGRMRWGVVNWTLRDPSELVEQACDRVKAAKREHEAIVRRVGRIP